jgi:putative ATP-binding cassette transporter
MFRALWSSPVRNRLLLLGGGIWAVIIATAYGQIRLNRWNQPFYDALSRRDFKDFVWQLAVFGIIAGILLALNVALRWLGETLKLKLREGLVKDLIGEWLQPRRAFRLANAGPMGVNPDQRMHEDARHLTELSSDLGIGLLQAAILLAAFINVLWNISQGFSLRFGAREWMIPGYMVWAAVLYAGSASLLSYWVGRSLVPRNAERYAREADLRYSLVRINEHIDSISLAGGEADEARRLSVDLDAVLVAMRKLVTGLTNLTWITAGYGWFTLVAPILVAAPIYFDNRITFGGLMMAAGAFTTVQSSLRWFVDNFSTIADWRATLLRVASFRQALLDTHELHGAANQIAIETGEPGKFVIDRLEIASPSGATMLEENHIELQGGERMLIVGETGTGKTLLFRALAGLWPWGAGRIRRPGEERLQYLPRVPYLPPGELRAVLAYPDATGDYQDEQYRRALERMQLQDLVPLLDQTKRWDQELSDEQRQRVVFARLVLQTPRWLLIDEALDLVDEPTLKHFRELLDDELKEAGMIHIGKQPADESIYHHVVHLVKDPDLHRLTRGHADDGKGSKRRKRRGKEPANVAG